MNIKNALIELDNSWSRDIILEKIKSGQPTDKIVNDFIKSNRNNIALVSNYVEKNNSNLLKNIEKLSICEIKLIEEIKSLHQNKIKVTKEESSSEDIQDKFKDFKDFNFALFLQKWSNSFVIYLLILISLVSLTKQAWAL